MTARIPARRPALAALIVLALAGPAPAQSPRPVAPVTLSDIRGMRFCEVLLIFEDHVDIYNTSPYAGCPDDAWQALDTAAIAAENGAKAAQLNGPHFWAMDAQTVGFGAAKTFGGIEAGYAATLPIAALGSGKGADPYAPYVSAKLQTMTFRAGRPVYELVGPDGGVYVLNAYGTEVTGGDPASLADLLSPAEGWSFRVSVPAEDLVIEGTSDKPVNMVGDDLHQYYTRTGSDG